MALKITVKQGVRFRIGDAIAIVTRVNANGKQIGLAIEAPKEIKILRKCDEKGEWV